MFNLVLSYTLAYSTKNLIVEERDPPFSMADNVLYVCKIYTSLTRKSISECILCKEDNSSIQKNEIMRESIKRRVFTTKAVYNNA